MKLLFKQRLFSWFDSHIGTVQERVLTFLPNFQMYIGDQMVGSIRKEFTFFKPKFTLDLNGWTVDGDWLEWDYQVKDGSRTVMNATKEIFRLTDTYVLDICREEDALICLMIVLAIDAAKCSSGND